MSLSFAILTALLAIGLLALFFGVVLGFAAVKFKVESDPLVEQIDQILPQTQCGQCGYPGCKPYAEAIANGDEINKCPPGGDITIKKLADLMGVEPKSLDAAHGQEDIKKIALGLDGVSPHVDRVRLEQRGPIERQKVERLFWRRVKWFGNGFKFC